MTFFAKIITTFFNCAGLGLLNGREVGAKNWQEMRNIGIRIVSCLIKESANLANKWVELFLNKNVWIWSLLFWLRTFQWITGNDSPFHSPKLQRNENSRCRSHKIMRIGIILMLSSLLRACPVSSWYGPLGIRNGVASGMRSVTRRRLSSSMPGDKPKVIFVLGGNTFKRK